MQRARRLASVVSLAVVGVLALGACGRSAPNMAAYVGDTTYSQSDVDQVIEQVKDQVPSEQQAELRRNVVKMMVLRDAATDYAEAHNISVPTVDPVAFAQQNNLPPGLLFTEIAAGYSAAMQGVQQAAKSATPTEADQREAHSHATVQGQPVTEAFETVKQYFGEEQIGQAVGFRNLLNEAIEQADVSVNPRYGDLVYEIPVQIGQATSWLAVPLTEKDGAVSDVNPGV